jgi:hypothetical protein
MNYNGNSNNKIMLTIPLIHVSKFSAKCVSASEVINNNNNNNLEITWPHTWNYKN